MTKLDYKNRWNSELDLVETIKSNCSGDEQNIIDLRGLPYGTKKKRNSLEGIRFNFIDFSHASFEECNFTGISFSNCIFKHVNFSELRQWNCNFENCLFEKSNFNNATMGVNSKFKDCTFQKTKLKGKYFSFGKLSLFERCNFFDCDIRSPWIISTTFESCIFESSFTNVRLSGMKEAEVLNITEKENYAATFINCNLTNSIFHEVEIMDGVRLEKTTMPNQKHERFNNDRIYYSSE